MVLLGLGLIVAMQPGFVGESQPSWLSDWRCVHLLQRACRRPCADDRQIRRVMTPFAIWAVVVIFGFPAVLFIGLGLADHLFDLRRGRP